MGALARRGGDQCQRRSHATTSARARAEPDRRDAFVRGAGVGRSFLVKYPESNHPCTRRMLPGLGSSVARAEDASPPGRADLRATSQRRALYAGPCISAYWHGLFGGLYVNYLRPRALRGA